MKKEVNKYRWVKTLRGGEWKGEVGPVGCPQATVMSLRIKEGFEIMVKVLIKRKYITL